MQKFEVLIIGGGASGIVAAISAKRRGYSAIICEKMPQLGKKILASGNGRCNLSNESLNESYYNSHSGNLVKSVFEKFGGDSIKGFFKEIGLEVYSENGRIFPITNQSSSVLRVLEIELKRLSIPIELNFEVNNISALKEGFVITSKANKKIESKMLIIACGGKSYPALGSDGSSYRFAREFGHTIIEPVPSSVPLVAKDPICQILQGQKIFAVAKSIINEKETSHASGELLFTKYGLSGTAVIDISADISVALNRLRKRDVFVSVDLMPFMEKKSLREELKRRIDRKIPKEELLAGLLPNKFSLALKEELKASLDDIVKILKDKRFKILGTRGWNEAEFTNGGVDKKEINQETLESRLKKGIYFAGEAIDIGAKRGGYNLAWAWASGFIAGLKK